MAITEETKIDRMEVLEDGQIQVRIATILKRDGVEISRTFRRYVEDPGTAPVDTGDPAIETAKQDARLEAVRQAVWTPEVVSERVAKIEEAQAARQLSTEEEEPR